MKNVLPALGIVALLLSAASAGDQGFTLSVDGVGPFKIGMSDEQIYRILQNEPPYNLGASNGCKQFTVPQLKPMGFSFVVDRNRLIRIDVEFGAGTSQPTARTDAGIGLGSAEEDVLKAYPAAVIKSNPADPAWHSIVVETPDHSRGLIFRPTERRSKACGQAKRRRSASRISAIEFSGPCLSICYHFKIVQPRRFCRPAVMSLTSRASRVGYTPFGRFSGDPYGEADNGKNPAQQ